MSLPTVEIDSMPTCSDCNEAKRFFQEHHIPYKDYNCEEDPKYAEEVQKLTGKQIIPTIKIDDHIFVGFSADVEVIKKPLKANA
ncbi:glutaredoxin family protein [Laceyella putida]|uniref:Glutaredoxin family protein n=1 Tax=Laceyella putida TaxID=110101 RepID=A0ABW2RQ63_9BACL